MNEERRELATKLRVGLFVLFSLAAFLGMIYALGARARLFEARYTIHAEFTEVGGLSEGATVRLAGVQIGRVSGVNLPRDPGGKVRVDLNITRHYADRIRKNSVARIDTQGLLGDKIIEITGGTADAPVVKPGEAIVARDPSDIGQVLSQGADTVKSVAALAESLQETAETFKKSRIVEDIAGATTSARRASEQLARITSEVEKGRGWAHALIYEEPVALRKLNDLLVSTQGIIERTQRGEGAVGVLTSPQSTEAARKLVAAMERIGRMAERPEAADSLVAGLLFDPKYKAVLEDLRVVAHNLRDVSDRIAGGKGTLGSLVQDSGDESGIRVTVRDLQTAVANLKAITEKINEGEGTIGALIADPTIYERLVTILDGAQRSFLLRSLIRGLGKGADGKTGDGRGGNRKE
jgi:phospholipid/cholesterol/gamma-HCH transport system substrate-binding protein